MNCGECKLEWDSSDCRTSCKDCIYGLMDCNGVEVVHLLVRMFKGNVTVEKLPWKPKMSEKYWCVEFDGVYNYYWEKSISDIMCFELGNCFKAQEEAERNKEKILSMLKE